jgi:PAS domain-containing protein
MIVSGLVVDMTERKKADEALKKSEMILRTFIENTLSKFGHAIK